MGTQQNWITEISCKTCGRIGRAEWELLVSAPSLRRTFHTLSRGFSYIESNAKDEPRIVCATCQMPAIESLALPERRGTGMDRREEELRNRIEDVKFVLQTKLNEETRRLLEEELREDTKALRALTERQQRHEQ